MPFELSLGMIIDIAVILFLLVTAVSSMKKGFIACVFGLLTIVVSFGVAFLFVNVVVDSTGGFFGVQESVTTSVYEALSEIDGFNFEFSEEYIRQEFGSQLPAFLIDLVIQNFEDQMLPQGTSIAVAVSQTAGKLAATVVAWFVLFIIAKILLGFLKKIITSLIDKISLIKSLDQLLGFVLGAAKGLIFLCVLLSLVTFVIPTMEFTKIINDTEFVYYLYNENPLTMILGEFI